jgi:hypothetical protein
VNFSYELIITEREDKPGYRWRMDNTTGVLDDEGLRAIKDVIKAATERSNNTVYERALATLPEKVTLGFVEHDDSLTDDQIRRLFAGGWLYEDATFDEWYSDLRSDSAAEVVKEHVGEDDRDILDEALLLDEVRFAVEERDDWDPATELLNRTGTKWMRYEVGLEVPDTCFVDDDELGQVTGSILTATGLDSVHEGEVQAMLAEASHAGSLWVFWHGDIAPLVEAAQRVDADGNPVPQTITFTGADLLNFDGFGGAGFNTDLPADVTITLPFDRDNLRLDAGDGSFSDWVCGGLYAKRDATVTITPNVT